MNKLIAPAIAALSLAVVATPVSAEDVSVEVRFADLDLSTPGGASALDYRVGRAIAQICGRDAQPLYKLVARRQCEEKARASADEQIAQIANGKQVIALNR